MKKKSIIILLFLFISVFMTMDIVHAASTTNLANHTSQPLINVNLGNDQQLTSSLNILLLVTVLSLAPSIFIMFTCFTHVIIVLGLTRQGLGTMTIPPNQVLVGLAIFITLYIMSPVINQVNNVAYKPYEQNKISITTAFQKAEAPIKTFMLKNTYANDLKAMLKLRDEKPKSAKMVSIWALVPAYTLSQISKGLITGLMIYSSFVFIDMIVASILMFMGMLMLPPQMISLPLKLAVFVFIGGFTEIIQVLFNSIKV